MKTMENIGLKEVQGVYSGPEGELWELIMGEQIHIGGFASSMARQHRKSGQPRRDLSNSRAWANCYPATALHRRSATVDVSGITVQSINVNAEESAAAGPTFLMNAVATCFNW